MEDIHEQMYIDDDISFDKILDDACDDIGPWKKKTGLVSHANSPLYDHIIDDLDSVEINNKQAKETVENDSKENARKEKRLSKQAWQIKHVPAPPTVCADVVLNTEKRYKIKSTKPKYTIPSYTNMDDVYSMVLYNRLNSEPSTYIRISQPIHIHKDTRSLVLDRVCVDPIEIHQQVDSCTLINNDKNKKIEIYRKLQMRKYNINPIQSTSHLHTQSSNNMLPRTNSDRKSLMSRSSNRQASVNKTQVGFFPLLSSATSKDMYNADNALIYVHKIPHADSRLHSDRDLKYTQNSQPKREYIVSSLNALPYEKSKNILKKVNKNISQISFRRELFY